MNHATSQPVRAAAGVPPRLAPAANPHRWLLPLGALALLVAGAGLFWFNPAHFRFFPVCFFHATTGWHCPGCGGTRALHQLLHGNVMAALHLNALLVVSLPFLAWWGLRVASGKVRRRTTRPSASLTWLWGVLALAVVFSVLRNLPAFTWLAP